MASDSFARAAFGVRDDDFRERQARLARLLFVGASAVAFVTVPFMPEGVDRTPLWIIAGVGIVSGLVFPVLPWRRWPWWALLLPPVLGFALLALAGVVSEGSLEHYLALYSLSFVYIGLVAPPRIPIFFVPLGVLSFAIGTRVTSPTTSCSSPRRHRCGRSSARPSPPAWRNGASASGAAPRHWPSPRTPTP